MKSNSRSGREILGKVAGILFAPFFIIFILFLGILSFFDDSYYDDYYYDDYYKYQSGCDKS